MKQISLITGFLGSGKTTLINSILEKSDDKKIAIIENEFSELGIDKSLIEKEEDNVFELNNGCICCTMSGEIEGILGEISKQDWDYVIVETTGVADPSPIIKAFFSDPNFMQNFELDNIKTLIDADNFFEQIEREYEIKKQIIYATTLIINKIDLVDENKVLDIEKKLKTLNPDAKIIKTTHSQIDEFFNQKDFDIDKINNVKLPISFSLNHLEDIKSIPIKIDKPISLPKFNFFIQTLLHMKGKDIYRLKGIVNIEGSNQPIIFQGVHDSISWKPGRPWDKNSKKESKIVLIGKNLDKKDIEEGIKNLIES